MIRKRSNIINEHSNKTINDTFQAHQAILSQRWESSVTWRGCQLRVNGSHVSYVFNNSISDFMSSTLSLLSWKCLVQSSFYPLHSEDFVVDFSESLLSFSLVYLIWFDGRSQKAAMSRYWSFERMWYLVSITFSFLPRFKFDIFP